MRKILVGLLVAVLALVGMVVYWAYSDTRDPYTQPCDLAVPDGEIPKFDEAELPFEHRFDEAKDLPIAAGAVIDVDDDGIDELFLGGGSKQADALFEFRDGGFVDISSRLGASEAGKGPTLGAVSFDLDEDGKTDLLLTRPEGVFLLRNLGAEFEPIKLAIQLDEKSNPGTLTVGDFDHDGDGDLFLSAYIKKELMEGQTIFNQQGYGANSVLLRNEGGLAFTDVTEALGLRYAHNTFQGVFVDVDQDSWLDLVVAYDTGEVRTYKNRQGTHFTTETNPLTGRFAYPMGIGVGDFDNDRRIDFFFSNTGSTVPRFLAKGDLREDQELVTDWLLFRNEGGFQFVDTAHEARIADFEFSWGAVFADFSLDGRQDLVVAENYIAFPSHGLFRLPCRFLLQRPDGTFSAVEEQAGAVNRNFAVAPVVSDFNSDGYPDLIWVNLGGKARALLSRGGDQRFIRVRFPESAAFVGSQAVLVTTEGETLSDVYVVGEGLASDSSRTLTFGLGSSDGAARLEVRRPNGTVTGVLFPEANRTYLAEELTEIGP